MTLRPCPSGQIAESFVAAKGICQSEKGQVVADGRGCWPRIVRRVRAVRSRWGQDTRLGTGLTPVDGARTCKFAPICEDLGGVEDCAGEVD